jgi:hypothetical protein
MAPVSGWLAAGDLGVASGADCGMRGYIVQPQPLAA